jgi:hypothetical protein
MLTGTVDIRGALKDVEKISGAMMKASDRAIEVAGQAAKGPLVANLSFTGKTAPIGQLGSRTGKLRSQVTVKLFRQRNGRLGVALKVMGDRAHIMSMHEKGTASHGRYFLNQGTDYKLAKRGKTRAQLRKLAAGHGRTALPARRVFEMTWKAIESTIVRIFAETFDREFDALDQSRLAS